MHLELTDAEVEVLRRLLDREARELSYEIADTDTSRFRDELRVHRDRVRGLLEKLGGPLPADDS